MIFPPNGAFIPEQDRQTSSKHAKTALLDIGASSHMTTEASRISCARESEGWIDEEIISLFSTTEIYAYSES